MKKLLILLLVVPMVSFGQINAAELSFNKTVHDFGTINEGETVETTFTFTNTGKPDLIIVDARASCEGCIVLNYPFA